MSWFREEITATFEIRLKIKKRLYRKKSRYQQIEILDTFDFGRILVLEGAIQLSSRDYHLYHEALAGHSLALCPQASEVLIVGGGDGALLTQVLRHPPVRRVCLVEIDEEVIHCCRQFFPALGKSLSDPRTEVHIQDGAAHVKRSRDRFDVVLVDAPDPEGPGRALFRSSFYGHCAARLKTGGVLAVQSESPYLFPRISARVCRHFKKLFEQVEQTAVIVPSYPGGSIGFTFGMAPASRRE